MLEMLLRRLQNLLSSQASSPLPQMETIPLMRITPFGVNPPTGWPSQMARTGWRIFCIIWNMTHPGILLPRYGNFARRNIIGVPRDMCCGECTIVGHTPNSLWAKIGGRGTSISLRETDTHGWIGLRQPPRRLCRSQWYWVASPSHFSMGSTRSVGCGRRPLVAIPHIGSREMMGSGWSYITAPRRATVMADGTWAPAGSWRNCVLVKNVPHGQCLRIKSSPANFGRSRLTRDGWRWRQ